jgi:hypothetical protein
MGHTRTCRALTSLPECFRVRKLRSRFACKYEPTSRVTAEGECTAVISNRVVTAHCAVLFLVHLFELVWVAPILVQLTSKRHNIEFVVCVFTNGSDD